MTPALTAWLSLDTVAQRYGVLPSELLRRGDTLDLKCVELALAYESHLSKKQQKGVVNDHGYSQDQLKDMIERVKQQ